MTDDNDMRLVEMRLVGRWVLEETDDTKMRRFNEVWMDLFGDGRLVLCADYGPKVGCHDFIYRVEGGEIITDQGDDFDMRRAKYSFLGDGHLRLDHGATYSLFRKEPRGAGPV